MRRIVVLSLEGARCAAMRAQDGLAAGDVIALADAIYDYVKHIRVVRPN
jgi:hypothetical protein